MESGLSAGGRCAVRRFVDRFFVIASQVAVVAVAFTVAIAGTSSGLKW
jgi:hypothetical protein